MKLFESRIPRLFSLLGIVALFLLAVVGTIFLGQHRFIYHPRPYPSNYQHLLPKGALELHFKTGEGTQTAFYLTAKDGSLLPNRIWVAFCGNGSLALDWLLLANADTKAEDAFLLIDYPGYGRSEGYATIATTRSAGEGALTALAAHLQISEASLKPRLNAIGHSLGAAVALDFATRHPVQRVILVSPFTSLRAEAAYVFGSWVSILVREDYDNRAALQLLARRRPPPRVTIFHGAEDSLIPARMGKELATEFPSFVSFHLVAHAGHNDIVLTAEAEIIASMRDN